MAKMSKKRVSITFTGDIGFDKFMTGKWTDENLIAKPVLDFLQGSDHVVANIEGAMTDMVDDGTHGQFFHSMDPAARCVLERIGADIWNIGNNHIMDAGIEGIISTKAYAAHMGSKTIGAGINEDDASEPVYLDGAGGIGILGVAFQRECIPATATSPGVFRWNNIDYIAKRIAEIKSRCRWCIIVSHGGEEFTSMPNPYTRDRYLKFLELGADVIVGHHPHVPENYETFDNGKAIFYSLGNFIFDTPYQRDHLYTDIGVLVKLLFTEDKMEFEAMGTKILRGPEQIDEGPLPDIFTDIRAGEYALLSPLAAKAHIAEERRRMIYLNPHVYSNASEETWHDYFFGKATDGYDKGAHMDLSVIFPFAATAEDGAWKYTKLEKVRDYLLKLI
jgi:hypothetical protein